MRIRTMWDILAVVPLEAFRLVYTSRVEVIFCTDVSNLTVRMVAVPLDDCCYYFLWMAVFPQQLLNLLLLSVIAGFLQSGAFNPTQGL